MEEVWRSYGPPEPIGPTEPRRGRRRALKIGAGVAAVCVAGAAAGLYLKPDLERTRRAETRSPAAAETSPGAQSDRALAEAQALQAQLQLAVADGAPTPVALAPAPPAVPGGVETPTAATSRVPPPPPAPQPNQVQRSASAFLRSLGRQAERPPPPPPARSAPAPQPRGTPIVVAEASPTPRVYPRSAPPVQRPRPAPPPQVTSPPVAERAPPAPPPPPDCSGARSAAEAMVCNSPELAALDRRMQAELAAAVAAGHRPDLLQRDQADWRRRRDAAAPDPRAVADAYQRRIGQLRSMQ